MKKFLFVIMSMAFIACATSNKISETYIPQKLNSTATELESLEKFDVQKSVDFTKLFFGYSEPMVLNACGYPVEVRTGFTTPWIYEYGSYYIVFEFADHRVFRVKYISK